MASVLHRTTKQYIPSANTPDHPVGQWIINPDLSAVVGFGSQYWTITGDAVTLMTAPQRAAVDAALVEAARDSVAAMMQSQEDINRAFMLVCLDEFNAHALKIKALLDAIDASTTYANLKTGVAAVTDYPQRTELQLRNAVRGKLGT